MGKWVKNDSKYATGSSGRVTRNIESQNKAKARTETAQKRQSNPTSKADKPAKRR